jgi:hypothetical protein
LRRLADFFNIVYDPDPSADGPITISRVEYDEVCAQLEEAKVPLRADREAAWLSFKGWRINYDTVLLNLARMVEAPIAPWTSDRSPLTEHERWTLRRSITPRRSTRARRWRRPQRPS